MNDIQAVEKKLVDFHGAEIMAVKAHDGKIYAGIKWVCEGIGLTRDQAKHERKKVQEDLVLQQGGRNLTLLTNGGMQEVTVIELEFMPLWLAKISITPKMQNESPEVVERLVEYQLKAKDVLADAFIHKKNVSVPSYMIDDPIKRAERWIEEAKETKLLEQRAIENEKKAQYVNQILQSKDAVTITQIAKDYGMSGKVLNTILHEAGVQYKQNQQWLLYAKHQDKGYTKSSTIDVFHKDGSQSVKMNTRWTQKGRLFIHGILEKQGVIAMIDREENSVAK